MNEEMELCTKVMILWGTSKPEELKLDPEYNSQSFIARMIRKKIEVFQVPIEIPDYLLMLIEICTDSNPGVSQVMLKEIMTGIKDLKPGHQITSMDFAKVYPMQFPIMSMPKWEQHFRELWDQQKCNGNNLCDTKEWWMEAFTS